MVTPQHFSSGRFISYIIYLRGLGICSMFCDETTVHFSVVSSLIESWWNLHHIRRAPIRSGWDKEESRYMFGTTPLQLRSMDHMPWSSASYMVFMWVVCTSFFMSSNIRFCGCAGSWSYGSEHHTSESTSHRSMSICRDTSRKDSTSSWQVLFLDVTLTPMFSGDHTVQFEKKKLGKGLDSDGDRSIMSFF